MWVEKALGGWGGGGEGGEAEVGVCVGGGVYMKLVALFLKKNV